MITWLINLIWGKRDWQLIDKEVIPSTMLEMLRNPRLKSVKCHTDEIYQNVILTFKCTITGKVKVVTKTIR